MTPDITLRGPGDIVSVLPYHLGYHPRDEGSTEQAIAYLASSPAAR